MASSGRTLYTLLNTNHYGKCSTKIAGKTNDPRYTKVGLVKENRLYDDNGVTAVERALPRYPIEDSIKYDWNLYLNRYYTWNADCEKSDGMDRASTVELLSGSADLAGYSNSIMIICIVHVRLRASLIYILFELGDIF